MVSVAGGLRTIREDKGSFSHFLSVYLQHRRQYGDTNFRLQQA